MFAAIIAAVVVGDDVLLLSLLQLPAVGVASAVAVSLLFILIIIYMHYDQYAFY